MTVVADAGMLSAANLRALDEAGLRFIVGSRMTKAPIDLESHFRWHGEAFDDGRSSTPSPPKPAVRRAATDQRAPSPSGSKTPIRRRGGRCGRSPANAPYVTGPPLTKQEERACAVIAGQKAARSPRFVKPAAGSATRCGRHRPSQSPCRAEGYVTNIDAATMSAPAVIAAYHDLWHVEASFRMSKTDLAARPMFARTRDAIEAHLTIVFAALAIARSIQARTGLALRRVIRQLRPLRSATIAINGTVQTFPPEIGPEQQHIIDAINGTEIGH